LFDKKKQYDFVEKLSGGEQKRLYLCAVLIQNPNFLILDEPTNDLDVVTLNVLENFLLDYPGNLLVVSHDRYFMDKIVDALFVFRGEGLVENFPGNYSDFRAYDDGSALSEIVAKPIEKIVEKKKVKKVTKNALSFNEKREFGTLEGDIERLQRKKAAIENQFLNVEIAPDDIAAKSEELQETIINLEEKEERWLELSMKLED
jgi:ATP-binding cassette subfamily F protein uup